MSVESDLTDRNAQFDFAMALNDAICDAIDAGHTESRAIAAYVSTRPKIKKFIAAIRARTLAQRPADCGAAMNFCEWLQGYFDGDWGRDELTPFEANTIRAELEKVFPGPVVTSTEGK